jgi:hypothetical protein
MKFLIAILAGSLSLQALATQVKCTLPPNTPIIEESTVSLTLSEDEKILVDELALGKSGKLWSVKSKTILANNGLQLKGITTMPGILCAGSCGSSSFTLTIQGMTNATTPNGRMEIISTIINEDTGKAQAIKGSIDYNCTISL